MKADHFRILIRRGGKRDSGFGPLASMLRYSRPECSVLLLKDELSRDPEASAAFFQTLKSFMFDSGGRMSFDNVVNVAGDERVRKVALASAMLTTSPTTEEAMLFDVPAYCRRCVTTAILLESLVQRYKEDSADMAFYTGLLMDAGYLVMLDNIPSEFQQALFKITKGGGEVLETERQHMGLDHTELGVVIAEEFGFPEQVMKGIEYCYRPLEAPEEFRHWCSLCHLASWLVDNLGLRIAKGMPEQALVEEVLEEIATDPDYKEHISSSVKFAAGICADAARYLSKAA